MITKTIDHVIDFLQKEKRVLMEEWIEKISIPPKCGSKDLVIENSNLIVSSFIESLMTNKETSITDIRHLATTVANQRIQTGSNIGEFIYNINLGRGKIQNIIWEMDLDKVELQEVSERINFFFDQFLYFSMTYYSEKQNKIIEEKTKFINISHKDRLTLLGQMTSSFIHEFRNPLTSVQGFIQLLKAENPEMSYLDIISIELEQLNFRISQFLLLSKKEIIGKDKIAFSLNELIEEVLIFLYPSILDGNVRIIKNFVDDIYLFGYADEIRQVLINIIFNAIDVLNGYTLDPRIEIKSLILNHSEIKLEIANNGPIIPEHLIKTIFEPFVTTKELGTGLGLFVCREIIEKHKGKLTCQTKDELTIFSIILPLSNEIA